VVPVVEEADIVVAPASRAMAIRLKRVFTMDSLVDGVATSSPSYVAESQCNVETRQRVLTYRKVKFFGTSVPP